jgi:predicted phage terminase large subunit-like protein
MDNNINTTKYKSDIYKTDFYEFVKAAYSQLGLGKYVDGWHIKLLCTALSHLRDGKFLSNRLMITIPPGHMKSLLVSVFFPLWVWTTQPNQKFLFISYADSRAMQDANRRRVLFGSEFYQTLFPLKLTVTGDNQARLINVAGGSFFASGIAGQILGEHVDYEILDDIMNADDRYSDVAIKKMIDVYDTILPNRFNDLATGKLVLICQRLSDRDIVGHIEERRQPFEKIVLAAEYDGLRYESSFPELRDIRTKTGELLWKNKFSSRGLRSVKRQMGEMEYASQFQQRTKPLSGNLFKMEWFAERIEPDGANIVARYIFADTAAGGGDYSAIMTVEVLSDYRLFIRSIKRGRWKIPELVKTFKEEMNKWLPYMLNGMVVEYASSGIQLIQIMESETSYEIIPYKPKGDKFSRASNTSFWCEKRRVLLPPPSSLNTWLLPFEEELFTFPNASHDDQIDCLSMCLDELHTILDEGYQASLPPQPEVHNMQWVEDNQRFIEKHGMSKEKYRMITGLDV